MVTTEQTYTITERVRELAAELIADEMFSDYEEAQIEAEAVILPCYPVDVQAAYDAEATR